MSDTGKTTLKKGGALPGGWARDPAGSVTRADAPKLTT